MIIDLKAIPREGSREFDFQLDNNWLNPSLGNHDHELALNQPLRIRTKVYRANDKYIIEGNFKGIIDVSCDRCLKTFSREIMDDFRSVLTQPPAEIKESEIELLEEDMEISFIKGDEIDLAEIVREHLFLSLPVKSICKEDCQGLCPNCGIDLNTEKCDCDKASGHPGFAGLKKLKFKENRG